MQRIHENTVHNCQFTTHVPCSIFETHAQPQSNRSSQKYTPAATCLHTARLALFAMRLWRPGALGLPGARHRNNVLTRLLLDGHPCLTAIYDSTDTDGRGVSGYAGDGRREADAAYLVSNPIPPRATARAGVGCGCAFQIIRCGLEGVLIDAK